MVIWFGMMVNIDIVLLMVIVGLIVIVLVFYLCVKVILMDVLGGV